MSIKDDKKRASTEKRLRKDSRSGVPAEGEIRDPRVRTVIKFMQANFHRKISLVDYGCEVNLSTDHISRLFSAETGLTPSEYLIRLRMQHARRLLTTTAFRIKEIMALTGYGNRSHFLEHFKRYFDVSPSKYRRDFSSS